MHDLETQVGQIYISNKKLSKSFVSLQSEKISETQAELFILSEIAASSTRAWSEAEKISQIFSAAVKNSFRKANSNSFENAIAEINDRLAAAVASGNSSWVGKTNACLAVRQGDNLFIATTGKIQAYLLRSGQLSDLADSPEKPSPLKTFENFAVGKLKAKDFLIISTPQLFNYISLDRFKQVISNNTLAEACQKIGETTKQSADQTISFGTFILEFGRQADFAAGSHIAVTERNAERIKQGAYSLAASTGVALKKASSKAYELGKNPSKLKAAIPKIEPRQLSEQLREQAKNYASPKKIKDLPRAKKFFLASALIFLVLLIVNIIVLTHTKKIQKRTALLNSELNSVQDKINQANIAAIYSNNPANVLKTLYSAQEQLSQIPNDPIITAKKQQTSAELNSLLASAGHLKKVDTSELLTYNSNVDQIKLDGQNLDLIDSVAGKFQAYNLKSNTLADISNDPNVKSSAVNFNQAGNLPDTGVVVPDSSKVISTKSSFYILDIADKKIIWINRTKNVLAQQYQSDSFTNLRDFAIDENTKTAYILNDNRVLEFKLD